jgi:hypothetical protein
MQNKLLGNEHPYATMALHNLANVVYEDLRKLAAQKMANEMPGQTLQPTALVHEAWLRLAGGDGSAQFRQPRALLRRRG